MKGVKQGMLHLGSKRLYIEQNWAVREVTAVWGLKQMVQKGVDSCKACKKEAAR